MLERVEDLLGRRKNRDYRVKSTMLKDIIGKEETERVKLRQLRTFRTLDVLSIDSTPDIDPDPLEHKLGRIARVANHYSLPGRTRMSPDYKRFEYTFADDERLKPNRDHSLLLHYVMEGSLKELLNPPGVLIRQPVGHLLVYEAHLPLGLAYEEDSKGNPLVRVYTLRTTVNNEKRDP